LLAALALARGDTASADKLTADHGELTAVGFFGQLLVQVRRLEEAGDAAGALALLEGGEAPPVFPDANALTLHGVRARVRWRAGAAAGAQQDLAAWREATMAYQEGHLAAIQILGAIEGFPAADRVLVELGNEATIQATYDQLSTWDGLRFSYLSGGVDHLRGDLALRLGLEEEADQHYRTGLAWAEQEHVPVEQGRCLQGLAQIAELRGDHTAALQFLDQAATIFQQHGLGLYLQQVLAKKDLLKA
jgi:hypothetical protein